jgi:hypothetical protein
MDEPQESRGRPGDVGTDYTVEGRVAQVGALGYGLRHNRRGRHRALRMITGLVVALCVLLLVAVMIARFG